MLFKINIIFNKKYYYYNFNEKKRKNIFFRFRWNIIKQ